MRVDRDVLDSLFDLVGELIIAKNRIDNIVAGTASKELKDVLAPVDQMIATRAEDHVSINVSDDGVGIDAAPLRKAFGRAGVIEPAEIDSMTDADVLDLLFRPGFSGTKEVTEVSGRGVGLDVVKTSVERMGGVVEVATEKGKGSQFTLRLPLTTTIIQTLVVNVGEHTFIVPAGVVSEVLEVEPSDVRQVIDERVLLLHGTAVPFIRVKDVLNLDSGEQTEEQKDEIALIVRIGERQVALGVDGLADRIECIIKPFDPITQKFKGFSGGTIMGDGGVALLLDVTSLVGHEVLRKERCAS